MEEPVSVGYGLMNFLIDFPERLLPKVNFYFGNSFFMVLR